MKKIALLMTTGIAFAGATSAMAQETPDFTGFRVEAVGGFDTSTAGSDTDNEVNEDDDQSIDGVLYGVGIGYDFNAGGVVIGAEAEIAESTAETEFTGTDFEGFGLGNVETGRDIYVGVRVGAPVGTNTLLYAKGGYTNARYNLNGTFDGENFRQAIDTDGFRVGAGVEYAFGQGAYAKLEYRYSNYSNAEVDFENGEFADVDLGGIDTDRHQVVAGVGFRF